MVCRENLSAELRHHRIDFSSQLVQTSYLYVRRIPQLVEGSTRPVAPGSGEPAACRSADVPAVRGNEEEFPWFCPKMPSGHVVDLGVRLVPPYGVNRKDSFKVSLNPVGF